jgi:hypothetical protein
MFVPRESGFGRNWWILAERYAASSLCEGAWEDRRRAVKARRQQPLTHPWPPASSATKPRESEGSTTKWTDSLAQEWRNA